MLVPISFQLLGFPPGLVLMPFIPLCRTIREPASFVLFIQDLF